MLFASQTTLVHYQIEECLKYIKNDGVFSIDSDKFCDYHDKFISNIISSNKNFCSL
jgi:hypothetical protein